MEWLATFDNVILNPKGSTFYFAEKHEPPKCGAYYQKVGNETY